jgi:transcriptional repressor NrdR
MKCPRCDSAKTRVVDSREGVEGRSVRRRRECESCSFRFTTFERIEESLPMVVKKGGQRESFDRYKILGGMKKACEKRPVSVLDLEDSIKSIETKLLESGEKEVSSQMIGEMVINALREIDQVAYVRFASVYREFSDISEFMDTLRQLASSGGQPVNSKNVYPLRSRASDTGSKKTKEGVTKAASVLQEELRFGQKPASDV